uniref:TPR_REGION domain-containing protein n=1 Tax=Anisakis simplex TaxID=6269 RepID=A0A0M3JJT6_ANISI
LKRDANNEKALFRRAKARMAVWDLDKAEDDLKSLTSINATNTNLVEVEMGRLRRLRAERETGDKSLYKNMFR